MSRAPDPLGQELTGAVTAGDGGRVAELLRGLAEPRRRALERTVRRLVERPGRPGSQEVALAAAVLSVTGSPTRAADAVRWIAYGPAAETIWPVLADRRPPWLATFVDKVTEHGYSCWALIRALVRAGAVPRPEADAYYTAMPRGIRWQEAEPSLRRLLLADPGLLTHEVWELFRRPGAERELYWSDLWFDHPQAHRMAGSPGAAPRPEATWRVTLAALATAGHIDRGRLLDECLGAFLRDFPVTQVGWYARLHAELAPTAGEVLARAGTYLRLLSADASAAVELAQRALGPLLRSGQLDPGTFLDHAASALHRTEKKLVTAQLRLLDQLPGAHPELAGRVAEVAAEALRHERTELQERALRLVRRHAEPTRAARILADAAGGLAPALRATVTPAPPASQAAPASQPTLAELAAAVESVAAAGADRLGLPAALAEVRAGRVPANPPVAAPQVGAPVVPVVELDELVALLTVLLEDAGDALAWERALGGAARLATAPGAPRAIAPLVRRAGQRWEDGSGCCGLDPRADLAGIVLAGSGPDRLTRRPDDLTCPGVQRSGVDRRMRPVTLAGAISLRARELVTALAAGRAPGLLAEPTHDQGAVDPDTFLQRLAGGAGTGQLDLSAAVLRLPPGLPDEFWRRARAARRAAGRAAAKRYRSRRPPTVEPVVFAAPDTHQWRGIARVALARSGEVSGSRTDDPLWWLLADLRQPLGDFRRHTGGELSDPAWAAYLPGYPLLAPWHPELVAGHLLRPLTLGVYGGNAGRDASAAAAARVLGPPAGPVGYLALATGLCGRTAEIRTAAADVVVAGCERAWLRPEPVADALCLLSEHGVAKLPRVTAALATVAGAGPLAAYRVGEVIAAALPRLLAIRPRDLPGLLGLAADIAASVGTAADPPDALAGLTGSSRLAAEARRLRQAAGRTPPHQAARDALRALLARVEPAAGRTPAPAAATR